jgi:hypothetical protein
LSGARIDTVKPADVAREVEALRRRGETAFTLRSIDDGGMLDRERLGAARYAAGLQAGVRVELEAPAGAAPAHAR